jgi:DNA-binding MarR family transcriptional regulator
MASPGNSLNGFGYLLIDTARLLRRRFEQKAADYNITSAQWRAMAQLSRRDALTQVGLAHILEIEPMSVCRLVDRMEAGGFVVRQPDPADKRAKLVYLTEKSRALLDGVRVVAAEVYEDAFAGFDEKER